MILKKIKNKNFICLAQGQQVLWSVITDHGQAKRGPKILARPFGYKRVDQDPICFADFSRQLIGGA